MGIYTYDGTTLTPMPGTSGGGGAGETLLAPVESSSTSSASYAVGDQFILDHVLYEATAAIAIGDTITTGTNCKVSDAIVSQIGEKQDAYTLKSALLEAGQTSVTFTGIPTTGTNIVSLLSTSGTIEYNEVFDNANGSLMYTFDAQSNDVTVYLKIERV